MQFVYLFSTKIYKNEQNSHFREGWTELQNAGRCQMVPDDAGIGSLYIIKFRELLNKYLLSVYFTDQTKICKHINKR